MNQEFTHFDQHGNAIMVDVSDKDVTARRAVAEGSIYVGQAVLEAIAGHKVKKGDVLGVARVAGIMAVKNTASLIPMCHTLLITSAAVEFELDHQGERVIARCTVSVNGKTGVEMEALTGVTTALLTIYDMCKAINREMEITAVKLLEKTGGKSGTFIREK